LAPEHYPAKSKSLRHGRCDQRATESMIAIQSEPATA
jgi:hypothetical protein